MATRFNVEIRSTLWRDEYFQEPQKHDVFVAAYMGEAVVAATRALLRRTPIRMQADGPVIALRDVFTAVLKVLISP